MNKMILTCFNGDKNSPLDKESEKIWLSLGISKEKISFLPKENNWWGPAGTTGPCGPDTEIFYWKLNNKKAPKKFDPNDKNWVEIWNNVFMQYNKTGEGKFKELKQKNVDTGMGVERTLAVLNGHEDNYESAIFKPIIKEIEKISNKKYNSNIQTKKSMRIIADHIRAATFILGDEKSIKPSNVGQGYVLRRLIRRAIRHGKMIGIRELFTKIISKKVISIYSDYEELKKNEKLILEEIENEEGKFGKTLEQGLKKFNELSKNKIISGKDAFLLFQSYGFPIELTEELAKEKEIKVDSKSYEENYKKHRDLSRTSSSGMFKSGLADSSKNTTKLHTATHLLNEALRIVLKNPNIKQKGSNINPERLRFDFNFDKKLKEIEIKEIENLVNEKISDGLNIIREEMSLNEALKSGAQSEFGAKYPEKVSIYTIIDKKGEKGWFSKEICTGPHVKNTKEIGKFKIIKEESVAAGIRRIKAVVY